MPEVSVFKNVFEVSNPQHIGLNLCLERIRDGYWEDIVTECRIISDKEEQNKFKQTMPTVTLSGKFERRADDKIIEHSEFIAIDLDDLENIEVIKRKLEEDKYVHSVFVSVSGYGLRVLFKISPSRHRDAFRGICNYIYENYGEPCDPNGINISKPYIVSFDPYLYISPDVVPEFKKYIKETPIKKMSDFVFAATDFDAIVKQITGRGVNICESYDDWLKVGFAISEQFGEDGRYYFHEVSRMSSRYKQRQADKQYTYCIRARGTTKINISTFYYLAKINNISIATEQTKIIVRTTNNGKKAGLSKEQIKENLEKFSSITGADKLIDDIFESKDNEFSSQEESVLFQLEMFISNNYKLRMNEVTGYLEQYGQQVSQGSLNTIFIAAKKLMPNVDYHLLLRLLKSDFIESYNPFYEFFGSDGIAVELPAIPDRKQKEYSSPLIDLLAETIENDNPQYTLFFLRKWLVSVISSAHKVHSPLLLCLLGKQNTGKTEFFRRLLPKELMTYYAESKLDKEKDDELLMTENLIIMDDELGGKSKQDNIKLKHITSKQYFSLRRPYGDHNEKILRLAVLCGTSNYNEVMSDPTGNRRIIPIDVIDIKKDLYNSINKKDLWMEAYGLYKQGFDWRVTSYDILYLNTDQSKYEMVIIERELIDKYFEKGDSSRVTTSDIKVELEKITQQRLNINAIGREMERSGFERKTTRLQSGATPKMWCVNRINRPKPESQPTEDLPF